MASLFQDDESLLDLRTFRLRLRSSFFCRLFVVRSTQSNLDTDASPESQADVLLEPIPVLGHPQDVLPRHQVQQEQHRAASQMALQL